MNYQKPYPRIFIFSIILVFSLLQKESFSQFSEQGSLFELYKGRFRKNTRISEKIMQQWGLKHDYLQSIHFNSNNPLYQNSLEKGDIIDVIWIYYNRRTSNNEFFVLYDDGIHFDNDPGDGIFGNYLNGGFGDFETRDIHFDIIQENDYGFSIIAFLPTTVNYLPSLPMIMSPTHQSTFFSDSLDTYWKIDPNADGCGIILIKGVPILGEELADTVWAKEYRNVHDDMFYEKIPVGLLKNGEYTLIVWSYTNSRWGGENNSMGAYSMDWSTFHVDKEKKNNSENVIVYPCFPNPFNNQTLIKYILPSPGHVIVNIVDILGREVVTLVNQIEESGDHYVLWNARDGFGNEVSSGVYMYTIQFNSFLTSGKMIVTK